MTQYQTCGDRSAQPAYSDRSELGRCEQRGLAPLDFEKIADIEDEDAEAGPAGADAGQREERIDFQDADGNQGVAHPLLDDDEYGEDDDADNHDDVCVRCRPAYHGPLIPGEVEEDQGGHAGEGAEDIDTLPDTGPLMLQITRRWGRGKDIGA